MAVTGANASLFCNVMVAGTGAQNLMYSWNRLVDGMMAFPPFLNMTLDRVVGMDTDTLTFLNVGVADQMGYRCTVSLFGETVGSADGMLSVQGKLQLHALTHTHACMQACWKVVHTVGHHTS